VNRLPLAAFAALAAATVGAFFVTQHLKVSTPLIAGAPQPTPAVIDPTGNGCGGRYRIARFSFYLLHRADDVAVYVVDQSGTIVRTLASGRHMRRKVRTPDGQFPWNGREDDGSVAPDGTYYFRVALLHQNRTVQYTKTPVQVKTVPPRPTVTSVSPSLIPQSSTPVMIRYRGTEQRGVVVRIYRTDLPGALRLVKSFGAGWRGASWDGRIRQRPAPAGTYLVGLEVTDKACNTGRFPLTMPPPPGSTAHAGITVRYLAAQPPLDPIPAGHTATVYVDARHQPYKWALQRAGARAVLAHGTTRSFTLAVKLPPRVAGLYVLTLRSGAQRSNVPLVASAAGPAAGSERVLVVLPALSWQGLNPVDDDGDGLPNTLDNGGPVNLRRPLANGLPAGFLDEASLLAHLDRAHLAYDLTTDLGLLDGIGPGFARHRGVVLAGSERWLPASLGTALHAYVDGGGHVLSLGTDSLRRGATVRGAQALHPSAAAAEDIFGARPGAVLTNVRDLITVTGDQLGIFSTTSGVFSGYRSYQQLAPGPAPFASAAGVGGGTAAIAGYRLGHGVVVEIGLVGFGQSLARNVDAQELIARLWQVLGR
jgi:FlgD Ig-like domain